MRARNIHNMDAPVVQMDVMVGWAFSALVQWVLVEPAVLSAYLLLTLLLKWCTDFSDLPEVRAEIVKQKSGVVNAVGRAKE